MPKVKKPAPKKGGAKKAAPKKAIKRAIKKAEKAIAEGRVLIERQADQLAADKMRADSFASTQPKHPTVEEQWEQSLVEAKNQGKVWAELAAATMSGLDLPASTAPPKPAKRGWWTRYQSSETGRFISAVKALADKAKSFGRRVLRKPSP